MLINFTVSNFLSINDKQTLSMEAGKSRKHSERIYFANNLKLSKYKAIFGANASGKSNLIEAFQFVQSMITEGLPRGFSNKYFRQLKENQFIPTYFDIELLLEQKRYKYGFSIMLTTGSILEEWLLEITTSGTKKIIFTRDIPHEKFVIGDSIKSKESIFKLKTYGEDSLGDFDILFLTIINRNKTKMFEDNKELFILKSIYKWFSLRVTISNPSSILTGYPYFSDSNLAEIANILNALGTGINNLKFVQVASDVVKNKIPEELYNKIVLSLEKRNIIAKKEDNYRPPSSMIRSVKEFYTFEIDENDNINIKTIEFSHEGNDIYFDLNEESDGTARLLDLIEVLFKISDERIFIIDEIDRCLHPAMTEKIVELFLTMANHRNTQLIVTSHESRLLANDMLRNDEICFILKSTDGSSIINPLEKYQLRADKKIYAALFDGTIDAIPNFDLDKLSKLTCNN